MNLPHLLHLSGKAYSAEEGVVLYAFTCTVLPETVAKAALAGAAKEISAVFRMVSLGFGGAGGFSGGAARNAGNVKGGGGVFSLHMQLF